MCGIYGIIGKNDKLDVVHIDQLLQHRGPDDHGIFQYRNLTFIHRRLAIQDLSSLGHQPMVSKNGRFVISFNGEIYNHQEIRISLGAKYEFISNSDTETILYGFEEYGVDLFNKLNGIFAFSILDIANDEVFLVRDHFGIKPLYYYIDSNQFIFSSELKTILNTSNVQAEIDPTGLVNYLYYLWSPGSQTSVKQISKLQSGHYIKSSLSNPTQLEIFKYYELPFDKKKEIKEYKYWESELEDKLLKSIERQLLSDVPVGFFLSGGLDSSLLVAIYRKLYPNKSIKAYTISTGKDFMDEGFENDLYYAKLVAKHLDVDLEVIESKFDIVEKFDHMIWHLDEPQSDLAPLHVENICRKAREDGFFVLLSGAGGDDLFSGYRRHQSIQYNEWLERVPGGKYLLNLIYPFISDANKRRLRKYQASNIAEDLNENLINAYGWCDLDLIKDLFLPQYQTQIENYDPRKILLQSLKNIPNEGSSLNKMLFWDIKYFLADHNLNYTDKLSMSQGIEVRVPYLDKDLVEFSTRLPVNYKMKGKLTKYILRKLAEKYLPNEVIYRTKTGFGAPVRHWIKGDLKDFVNERLSKETLVQQNIFNPMAVKKLIDDNEQGKLDGSYTILSLLAIESFVRQFLNNRI